MMLPSRPADAITDLDGLEEVRELGSSRFSTVRLLRCANSDGTFELFAAKFYNVADNREEREVFEARMKQLLRHSHPHVMPIVGVISPMKSCCAVLLTRYNEIGSLEAVLSEVRLDNPPWIWNDETKLHLLVSLVSCLNYLHKKRDCTRKTESK
jgi:hypothetical protein